MTTSHRHSSGFNDAGHWVDACEGSDNPCTGCQTDPAYGTLQSIDWHLARIAANPGDGAERRIRIDSQLALRKLDRKLKAIRDRQAAWAHEQAVAHWELNTEGMNR